uniref:Uncharacterized protein n=1 Tax=Candidatus Kentrum sp. LPFa TaxID=2126335 RepID=A0A450W8T3_9GAMM|nr:MAG: hypothetical protein BECKLPF1236A_GA0070988_100872 [Candidatus Kentron sp. LPFa]VFK29413.1 MAG: hypothetical protein BECKLPF1236C_GA0070990_100872 [Candidatus Kentron sp. LPFa]
MLALRVKVDRGVGFDIRAGSVKFLFFRYAKKMPRTGSCIESSMQKLR